MFIKHDYAFCSFILIFACTFSNASPVNRTFTYQGRLVDGNRAANGSYDFQFKIFNYKTEGIQFGPDVNQPGIDVVDGYFTAELDFGMVFDGNERWLEIGVRPGDQNDPNIYTVLVPRQRITPVPYALHTQDYGPVNMGPGWQASGTDSFFSGGNVGIGTYNPATTLDVAGIISSTGGNSSYWNTAYNWGNHADMGYLKSESDPKIGEMILNRLAKWNGSQLVESAFYENEGNVGLGTVNPLTKLDVAGVITALDGNSDNWNAAYHRSMQIEHVKTYGAKGDGITDDTAAFATAISSAAGKQLYVPDGVYILDNLTLHNDVYLDLAPGAILRHKPESTVLMINTTGANTLKIRGGTLDGNKEHQNLVTYWPVLIAGYLENGKKMEFYNTKFVNTVRSAIYIMKFGGVLLLEGCEFSDMSEGGEGLNCSCGITIVSGEPNHPGFMRVSKCRFTAAIPASVDGKAPGGMFLSAFNDSTLEVEGCYFRGIGQYYNAYDIASVHVYPRWNAVRLTNNYFEQCAFAAICVKSVHNFVCTGNVIYNGQTNAKHLVSEGAIAYDPGYQPFHADEHVMHPRAIISNNIIDNPGAQTDVGKVSCIAVHGTPESHANDVIISNNILRNGGYGLYIVFPENITISNNIIHSASDGRPGADSGIHFYNNFGETVISGNRITTPNGMGLICTDNCTNSRWYVIGNMFNHSSASAYACTLRGMAYLKFAGNTFNATAGYALIVQGDSSGNPVGWLAWDNSNTILSGPVSFNWNQISKVSGQLSGVATPYNRVMPGEAGTIYRQTDAINNVLWQALGTTKTSWVPMATSNISPATDSTTAVQVRKADGTTSILNVDTVNSRVGIGTNTPARAVHINDVMRLQPRSAPPVSPAEGDIYMDSGNHKLMVFDGNSWQACW